MGKGRKKDKQVKGGRREGGKVGRKRERKERKSKTDRSRKAR